jgi:tagatose-1,6-bisphosphate aldolase
MTYATQARTLDDIAADNHVFSIIAMDQRNTLRRMFTAVGLDATDDDLRMAKADVARVLTPAASGLLSDPTYGVPAITAAKALAPECGLLVAAEPSEYPPRPGPERPVGPGSGRRCPQVLPPTARRPPGLHGPGPG